MRKSFLASALALLTAVSLPTSMADVTLFFNASLEQDLQEEQHDAFLSQVCADACVDFDDREAGSVEGTEWVEDGITFIQPSSQGLRLAEEGSSLVSDSSPNSLWPVGPDERIGIRLEPPRMAIGFWVVDSERNFGNDFVEFLDADGTVLESVPMPAVGDVVDDRSGHFFVGVISDDPVAEVLISEGNTDREAVGIDSLTTGNPCSRGKIPGDCNGDRSLDISDAICMLQFLFTGGVRNLPCTGLGSEHPSNIALLDFGADGALNISDPIALLNNLFLAGPPHPLARGPGCDGKPGYAFLDDCF